MKRLVLFPMVLLVLLSPVLLAGACGQSGSASPKSGLAAATPRAANGIAYVLAEAGKSVVPIDLATAAAGPALPRGVLSPDGHKLYAVSGSNLSVIDTSSGASPATYQMPAAFELPQVQPGVPAGLSHNGKWLLLESVTPARSRFWRLDVTTGKGTTVDLDGKFEFDGIADDGSGLYLLQWLPNQPGRYSVRVYDFGARTLQPYTLTDKTENLSSMSGTRLASVTEPTGHWQYTLYMGGPTGAFVHALELMGDFPIAWCVELPALDPITAQGWSIAMTADGSVIYAANPAAGKLATIHPQGDGKPTIDRVADIGRPGTAALPGVVNAVAKEMAGGLAVLDADRMYVPGSTGIEVIDLKAGRQVATWLQSWGIRSLALVPGGGQLLAIDQRSRLLRIDTTSGADTVVATALGNADAILGVR